MKAHGLAPGLKLLNALSEAYARDCAPASAAELGALCETASRNADGAAHRKLFSEVSARLASKGKRPRVESIQALFEAIDNVLARDVTGDALLLAHCTASEMASEASRTHLEPEAAAWLIRRSAYDYQCSWLALVGLGKNPFVREHPSSVPGLAEPVSEILSLLVCSNDIVRIQGGPGVGKTAFLYKLCESLLSQQLNGRSVLPCYVPNQRSSAKLFAVDMFAGLFTRYSVALERLKLSELLEYLPHGQLLDEHVVLPGHAIEDLFKKVSENEIVRQIASHANSNRLALIVLLDDASGKIRGPLSATQVNALISLRQQCEVSAVIAVTAPEKALPRVLEDHRRADLTLMGLCEAEVRAAIQAFYSDARAARRVTLGTLKPLSANRLYDITIGPWEKDLLGESYAEDQHGRPYFHPRRAKRMAALLLERLSTDVSNMRFAPINPEDITQVKLRLARTY